MRNVWKKHPVKHNNRHISLAPLYKQAIYEFTCSGLIIRSNSHMSPYSKCIPSRNRKKTTPCNTETIPVFHLRCVVLCPLFVLQFCGIKQRPEPTWTQTCKRNASVHTLRPRATNISCVLHFTPNTRFLNLDELCYGPIRYAVITFPPLPN